MKRIITLIIAVITVVSLSAKTPVKPAVLPTITQIENAKTYQEADSICKVLMDAWAASLNEIDSLMNSVTVNSSDVKIEYVNNKVKQLQQNVDACKVLWNLAFDRKTELKQNGK